MASSDFAPPDFDAPLDVEEAIARTPAVVQTKGMFTRQIVELGRRAAPSRDGEILAGVPRRHWMPFLDYPLREHMRLLANVAPIRYAGLTMREGLRRLGWSAFATFADSMAGKVVLGAVGGDIDERAEGSASRSLESVLAVADRGISLSISHGKVVSRKIEPGLWELYYSEIWCFLDSYHVGIIEGVFRTKGIAYDLRVKLRDPVNGIVRVRF
jgi:uncharacterized protein (TIGR02265 family)